MSMTYEVKVDHLVLKTNVINTEAELDKSLRDLVKNINKKSQCVVGLDIEKDIRPYPSFIQGSSSNTQVSEKVAVLKLCYGKTCLIVQLLRLDEAPCSLSKFLQLNWISFVGVGIKHCLEALDMNYGIKCRNAVDLGELAANAKDENRFKGYALLDLLKLFCHQTSSDLMMKFMSSCHKAALTYWGASDVLSEQQIEAASLDAYVCFYLGKNFLLHGSRLEYYTL